MLELGGLWEYLQENFSLQEILYRSWAHRQVAERTIRMHPSAVINGPVKHINCRVIKFKHACVTQFTFQFGSTEKCGIVSKFLF